MTNLEKRKELARSIYDELLKDEEIKRSLKVCGIAEIYTILDIENCKNYQIVLNYETQMNDNFLSEFLTKNNINEYQFKHSFTVTNNFDNFWSFMKKKFDNMKSKI